MSCREEAKGKGDYGKDHEGGDDNGRVAVFVYFHADSPIILFVFILPFFDHFCSTGCEHIDQ